MRRGRVHALRGIRGVEHVIPVLRRAGVGVHEQRIARPLLERQVIEKMALLGAKLAAGPFDRNLRFEIHAHVVMTDGAIVIADQCDRAVADQLTYLVDHPFRVGAIANVVAEQHELLRAPDARGRKASFKGLPVGMDVRKNRCQHVVAMSRAFESVA